jgi:hypothetical protein
MSPFYFCGVGIIQIRNVVTPANGWKELAVSIGHGDTLLRDQLLEDFDCLLPTQRLTWSSIQFCRYSIKFFLGMQGQIGAFRKYCRSSPFVFSLVPRCHGECGSQK